MREAYSRRSCVLRNSAGLYEGGCFLGYRAIGVGIGIVCASEGGSPMATVAVVYGRGVKRFMRRMEAITFEGGCNRGGILTGYNGFF